MNVELLKIIKSGYEICTDYSELHNAFVVTITTRRGLKTNLYIDKDEMLTYVDEELFIFKIKSTIKELEARPSSR